jgi:hypothetical protein
MKLYVETMDVTVVEINGDGRVRLDTGEWIVPTLQERRAIIHAAEKELSEVGELLDVLNRG